MKKYIVALCAFLTFSASAQIEVLSVTPGMTKAEVDAIYPNGTIGLSPPQVEPYNLMSDPVKYENGKVVQVSLLFNIKEFPFVLAATQRKFPKMKCDYQGLVHLDSGTYRDYWCVYETGKLRLTLLGHIGEEAAGLILVDNAYLDRQMRKK